MTPPTILRPIEPSFVPAGADLSDEALVERLFDELERRDLSTTARLERWIADAEELRAATEEPGVACRIALARRTSDATARAALERYEGGVREISARRGPALDARYLTSPARAGLDPARWLVYDGGVEARASLVPEIAGIRERVEEYHRVVGSMTARWDGQETPLSQLMSRLHDADRTVRERAWRLVAGRRLADEGRLDRLFDELLELRAGDPARSLRERGRFDYGLEECRRLDESIERVFVPLRRRANEERRRRLGVDQLRPWDLQVDPEGRPPSVPFDPDRLIESCRRILGQVDPGLARTFDALAASDLLDLDRREDKAPGAFLEVYPLRRLPFLYLAPTGRADDLRTLLRESGRAFRALACRDEPIFAYRKVPIEFDELVGSAIELLGTPHLGAALGEADRRRSVEDQHRRLLEILVQGAAGDAFQDWLYSHPGHAAAERARAWIGLQERYDPGIDWSGLEEFRGLGWQRVAPFFETPFHYVEYAVARIGALQVRLRQTSDPSGAVRDLRRALALGGSRPLPELYAAAGAPFAFDERALRPLAAHLRDG